MQIKHMEATGYRDDYFVGVAIVETGARHRIAKIRRSSINFEYYWWSGGQHNVKHSVCISCPDEVALSLDRVPRSVIVEPPNHIYHTHFVAHNNDGVIKNIDE
ncbi:hypothetical protein TWF718_002852 [Orbilia javanica]|uniref:Uncharacterized protein n=1 Tax=Orbilia javanica TaxID=47235 RepID=A0AAN8MLH4_9PEZI